MQAVKGAHREKAGSLAHGITRPGSSSRRPFIPAEMERKLYAELYCSESA